MMPNTAKATKPSAATRTASCGEIGERRSWTGSITRGAAPAPARVLGQGGQQDAAHERVQGRGDDRVEQDRGQDLAGQQQADRRVDAEQELHERVAHRRAGGGGGAHQDRRQDALGIAQLAQAAGAVAGPQQHERGEPDGLHEREVEEQPGGEAEDGTRHGPAQQADRGDHQRRQVGVGPEQLDLRDGGDLQDDRGDAEGRQAGDELDHGGAHAAGRLRLGARVSTSTNSRRRRSA
jgi:hypothetical protein